jgi:hypothetical protein
MLCIGDGNGVSDSNGDAGYVGNGVCDGNGDAVEMAPVIARRLCRKLIGGV